MHFVHKYIAVTSDYFLQQHFIVVEQWNPKIHGLIDVSFVSGCYSPHIRHHSANILKVSTSLLTSR